MGACQQTHRPDSNYLMGTRLICSNVFLVFVLPKTNFILLSFLYGIMDAMPPLVVPVTLMHSLRSVLIRSCQSLSILLVVHKL